jgi:hypothetical protein
LVPARNGCIPEDPDGWHSTHAGALLEGAVAALPEDPPPEAGREDDVVLDRLPETPPEAPLVAPPEAPLEDGAPPADPVAEPPAVVLGVA